MSGGADRVAHVVEAIEERDQVVAGAGEALGVGDFEAAALGDAGFLRGGGSAVHRRAVVIETDERGLGEGFGHHDGGGAVAAADVGDFRAALQLRLHSFQRRQPFVDE